MSKYAYGSVRYDHTHVLRTQISLFVIILTNEKNPISLEILKLKLRFVTEPNI